MEKKIRFGLVGSGHLGSIVIRAWQEGLLPDYELVYIAGRDAEKAGKLVPGIPGGDFQGLLAAKPDYIVEAASVAFLKAHAMEVLEAGINLVVISVGAFADPVLYRRAGEIAREKGVKLIISNGVTGGFDILRTFRLLGETETHFTTHKGPASLRGTPLHTEALEQETEERTVFDGTAEEIIGILPTKVNVAIASSLAASSPAETKATMVSVPGMIGDDHCMISEVNGNRAVIDIYTTNGSFAAYGLVATLQNIASPVQFA